MPAHSQTCLRVRYAETDQMGVVHHANYLVWMEVGRVELCKSLGFNYRDMERDDGIYLVVADATCRYRAPARFDDEVTVKTRVESANKRIVVFAYEIHTGDRLLATASTRHVFVSRQMERTRLPQKYYPLFGIPPDRTELNPA
jgi:acyl-CoA thioester hydrolase